MDQRRRAVLDELRDEADGSFVVITEDGAAHYLDLDRRLVMSVDIGTERPVRESAARLLVLATCRVGAPMVMLIDRELPGIRFTRRTTAVVTRIDAVEVPRMITGGVESDG